jgi:hypothetical protein
MTKAKIKGVRFKKRAAQGELDFTRLPDNHRIPSSTRRILITNIKGQQFLVIGHSETGHHHVMDPEKTEAYELGEGSKILIVKKEDALNHLREQNTHQSLIFEPGKYMVKTLKEFDAVNQQARLSRD